MQAARSGRPFSRFDVARLKAQRQQQDNEPPNRFGFALLYAAHLHRGSRVASLASSSTAAATSLVAPNSPVDQIVPWFRSRTQPACPAHHDSRCGGRDTANPRDSKYPNGRVYFFWRMNSRTNNDAAIKAVQLLNRSGHEDDILGVLQSGARHSRKGDLVRQADTFANFANA